MEEKAFNAFEKERIQFTPVLPDILKQIEILEPYAAERVEVSTLIQSIFPKTFDQPLIKFHPKLKKQLAPMRVGVLFSGGQAPGGHNVITGLFDALKKMHSHSRLFGFLNGPAGALENAHKELVDETLASFRNTGGFDLIGSGRTKIEMPEQFDAVLKNCTALNLDGFVIIGGDDSNTNAALLAEFFCKKNCKTQVIGVPKTIDGDLKNAYVETSFGFDTACKIYSEMIGNICRDALSAKKYTHFIKLMGRSASHIALECALQTHPNMTLIGEEIAEKKMTLRQITEMVCECIVKRSELGCNYSVILIPEGLIEFVPEMKTLIQEINSLLAHGETNIAEKLSKTASETFAYIPKEISQQLLLDRDPHGNVQVSHIATEQLLIHTVNESLKNQTRFKGKFSPLGHFFGYEGRCGYPSNFDANYCYALGYTAAVLITNRLNGYMAALQKLADPPSQWMPIGVPLTMMMAIEERKGKKKPVIKKALVDLQGEAFKLLAANRQEWVLKNSYRFPGPIQFAGPPQLCNETTFTLKLEQNIKVVV